MICYQNLMVVVMFLVVCASSQDYDGETQEDLGKALTKFGELVTWTRVGRTLNFT